jgi:hypothetical protein
MEVEYSQESSRLAAKYDFIVYPLDYAVLKKTLMAQEYRMPQARGQAPPDSLITVDGIIGKKEEFTIDVNSERQVFGVSSTDYNKLESEFNKLESILSNEVGTELRSSARFYEFIYDAAVRTGNSPLRAMAKLGKGVTVYEKMSKILGANVSPLNVRVLPTDVPIESENWFEFTIEPILNKSNVLYHIGFVFRNKDQSIVLEKISNLKRIVDDVLKLVES